MVFTKFVEVGRVIQVTYGDDTNKIAVITDIIDHNRAIVDGPTTGVKRQVLSFRRMNLTPLKVDLPRGARSKTVKKFVEAAEIAQKWAATATAKKIARRETRRSLGDFDRFKVMCAQKKKAHIVKA